MKKTYVRYIEGLTLPTLSSSYHDTYFNLLGNPNKVYFCMKGNDDLYDWVNIASGEVT